jgi:hypothetical protein
MAKAEKRGRFGLRRGNDFYKDLRGGGDGSDGDDEWLVGLGGPEQREAGDGTTDTGQTEAADVPVVPAVLAEQLLAHLADLETHLADLEAVLRGTRAACSASRALLERAQGLPPRAVPRSAWAEAARDKRSDVEGGSAKKN